VQPLELLIFRNYSGIEEPAFKSPIGHVSIRNGIVFGVFLVIAVVLHRLVMPDSIEFPRDLLSLSIVLTPIIIGLVLVMIKPQFGTADAILISMICVSQNKKKKDKIKIKSKTKSKSTVLGFAKNIKKEIVSESDVQQVITCSDLDELKGFKIQLHHGDGSVLSDKLVKCYLDNDRIDTIKTSLDGVLIVKFRPEKIGKRLLVIRNEQDEIILEKSLLIKKK